MCNQKKGHLAMIKTKICDMLGIEYPIVQAAMGPYPTNRLAASVSDAGGLGVISHSFGPKATLDGIRQVVKLTDKNFGVNVRVAREQPDAPIVIDAIVEERKKNPEVGKRLKAIITSGGDPTPYVDVIKVYEALHFHVVPSVYHAQKVERAGVDGIIAAGQEGGGHVNPEPVHTFVLVPAVVKAVKLPVLLSGGACDGTTLVAALAFGAQGVYMGTRFMATQDSDWHFNYKKAIVKANERDTEVVPGVFGPLRCLKNQYTATLKKMGTEGASWEEMLDYEGWPPMEKWGKFLAGKLSVEELLKGSRVFKAMEFGDTFDGAMPCGEVTGRINSLPTVKEVIEGVIREAEEIIQKLSKELLSL